MEEAETNQAVDPRHVPFGRSMVIRTDMRLPDYDNGSSLAYEAYDQQKKGKRFIAFVCEKKSMPRLSAINPYKGLVDTSFLNLIGFGPVSWPGEDSQRMVFTYMHDMGKPLVSEGQLSDAHWRHPEIIEFFIHPMARMFKEMKDKSFGHGSIRASNIFYASGDRNVAVTIGDCLSVQTGSTQPTIYLTAEKALADPLGRGFGSLADDIYAFGVSLFMFLRKSDEIDSLSDEEIIQRKMEVGTYATLIGKERLHGPFVELLRGLVHDDEKQRWGVDEILLWLDGTRLTPLAAPKRIKANRPIVFAGKKYLFPEILAIDMRSNPNAVAEVIENGSLEHWVAKSITDDDLAARFEKILERGVGGATGASELAVSLISMALNPALPIYYKGKSFTVEGFGSLLAHDAYLGRDLSYYEEVLNINLLDTALIHNSNPQNLFLTGKIYDTCRSSIKKRRHGNGIERCIYTLFPDAPCMSPLFENFFVYNGRTMLSALEKLCARGGQTSLLVDIHISTFFSVRQTNFTEKFLYDLNHPEKDRQIAGNLHFIGAFQKKENMGALSTMAAVFLDSLSGVYKAYKNKGLRENVQKEVEKAAAEGSLVRMSALLEDINALARDEKGFQVASLEYKMLQKEYNTYNARLAKRSSYGVADGHDVASIVSWFIATGITVLVILAFLSGNQIF